MWDRERWVVHGKWLLWQSIEVPLLELGGPIIALITQIC